MDPKDIWRAADMLIRRHGDDAVGEAVLRAVDMRRTGDGLGETVWIAVAEAVTELQIVLPGKRVVH